MTNTPDSRGLITKEQSEIIHDRLFSFGGSKTMTDMYKHILETEPYCALDIQNITTAYTKTIVSTVMASIMQSPVINDEFIVRLSEPVKKLLQNSFAAGAIYCQAKMEQDFVQSLEGTLEENIDRFLDETLISEEEGPFYSPEDENDGDITIQ